MARQEMVIAMTGARGSGKSLMLAYVGLMAMSDGIKVYSNFPVSGEFQDGRFEAEGLDILALYQFDARFDHSFLLIDEMQFSADARRSGSNANRLLNFVGNQLRKKSLSIAYSVQNFAWVDNRWRFQTDLLIKCRDLCHSPWGKENGVARGEQFFLQFFDLSGVVTGTPFSDSQRSFRKMRVFGKPLWPMFDTQSLVSFEEAFRSYEMAPERYRVGPVGGNGGEGSGLPAPDLTAYPVLPRGQAQQYLGEVLAGLREQGHETVRASMLTEILTKNGVPLDPGQLGKSLRSMNVPSKRDGKGISYNLLLGG